MYNALAEIVNGTELPSGLLFGPGIGEDLTDHDREHDKEFLGQYYPEVESDKFYYLIGDDCAPDSIWESPTGDLTGDWICVWTSEDAIVFRLDPEGSKFESTLARFFWCELDEGADDVAVHPNHGAAALMTYGSPFRVIYPEDGVVEDVQGVIIRQTDKGFVDTLTYTSTHEAKADFALLDRIDTEDTPAEDPDDYVLLT